MKVYVLIHETYGWWDNDYTTQVYTFKDKQSAINYLAVLREMLLDDALKYNDLTIEDLTNSDDDYLDIEDDDSFTISIEEWGSETLWIKESDVMEMN